MGHPYPFVCSTNIVEILDEACLRRFTFKIKFDFLYNEQTKIAFKYFFKLELPEKIIPKYGITVGDLTVVKRKAKYLGLENSPAKLYNLLLDEIKMWLNK